MEEALAKLMKKNDILGEIVKVVIERAKGDKGEAAWISTLPQVCKDDFKDAEVLSRDKTETKMTLRKDKGLGKEIVLPNFDPNFKSDDVPCRHPTCHNKKATKPKRGQGKRDLYLCCDHREELKSRIRQAFESEEIEFSIGDFTAELGRFDGYTSLIGVLEGAFRDARKLPTIRDTSEIVEEAILNVRNFLIITSTLLNPDDDNLGIALPPVFHIFRLMLQNPCNMDKLLQSLLSFLKGVISTILFAFGVIYTWVSLANPGTQIGIGVGGFIGAAGFALGPLGGVASMAIGGVLGGFIGSGIYKLTKERSDQQNLARARQEWLAAVLESGNSRQMAHQFNPNQQMFIINGNTYGHLEMNLRRLE